MKRRGQVHRETNVVLQDVDVNGTTLEVMKGQTERPDARTWFKTFWDCRPKCTTSFQLRKKKITMECYPRLLWKRHPRYEGMELLVYPT